ncbi:MAG: septum formation protein [Myxococcota bacterium]|jgi:septum formation protein
MALQIVLASGSPRRKELLERLGFNVKAIPAQIPEERLPDETAEYYVKRLAREKVLSVVGRIRTTQYTDGPKRISRVTGKSVDGSLRWVIGADTVVVSGPQVLEKPRDNVEAYDMLLNLAGREHEVITGFCLFDMDREKEGIQAVRTRVRFKPMTKSEVEKYVSAGESMDKAGAYAIQGVGAYLVEEIEGSYTNVVGLPLCQVIQMMEEMGAREALPF